MRARSRMLPDRRRLHLQDGPIDLVVQAFGRPAAIETAYAAATRRFGTILDELCGELPQLRAPVHPGSGASPDGVVARRMWKAVMPFAADTFITPMAAVAGSVAEEILAAMTFAANLDRAYVNNGGDIALHLAPGESLRAGLVDKPDAPALFGSALIRESDGIGGIATSGWRGRSVSRGIADAVTVLAGSAAAADAAATIVANAVDLPGHHAVSRLPASDLQCDSDLGDILVTRGVGHLSPGEIDEALARGRDIAEWLIRRGLIEAAALHLQGVTAVAGSPPTRCTAAGVKPATGPLSCVGEGWGEGPHVPTSRTVRPIIDPGAPSSAALPSPGRPPPRALDLSLTGEADRRALA